VDRAIRTLAALLAASALTACRRDRAAPHEDVLPASADITRAFERLRDPFRDPLPYEPRRAEEIKIGYLLFTQTAKFVGPIVAGKLSCSNCHLNAGQRHLGLPLVGVARVYPEYVGRAGRALTLEDRIVGCLLRSTDAANGAIPPGRTPHENAGAATFPSPRSFEVRAIAAYLGWISEDVEATPWRGQQPIAKDELIPVEQLDPDKGAELYAQKCQSCHGANGEGVHIGWLFPGPLWGEGSWNDGAGFARPYTLAQFLRGAMPYSSPGSLRDDEAQHIAAFIDGMPRPVFLEKPRDYPGARPPDDAVYYEGAKLPRGEAPIR
jgi:thiosulfate dehydrogenase